MYSPIKFILSLVIFFSTSHATIHHIQSMQEVLQHLPNKRILIVFDIDNTLLMPPTHLGSDQWFSHLVQEQIASGKNTLAAVAHVLPLYLHVQLNIDLVPTERSLSEIFQCILDKCAHVLFLTARSAPLATRTFQQLAKNNLHFPIMREQPCELNVAHPCFYRNDILFCGNNDKGEVIDAFLDIHACDADVVVFIDDKEKYVGAVHEAVQKRGIECIGFRYGGCEHLVRSFNKEATKRELEAFLEKCPLPS